MFRIKTIIQIPVLLLLLTGLAQARPVSILEETENYIKIRFELPEWRLEDIKANNQDWKKIICSDGTYMAEDGHPLLISFSEAIGIPVNGDIQVSVLSQKIDSLGDVKLLPAERQILDRDRTEQDFYQDYNAYSQKQLYPQVIAEKGTSAYIGNRNMIPLHIYPFQYNPHDKHLLVTTEAVILISITGDKRKAGAGSFSPSIIDSEGDAFFLNNRTSFQWRKARDISPETAAMPKSNSNLINALQFIIDQEGIYKITYQYLQEKMQLMADSLGVQYAWSVETVDPRYLELSDENGAVAIHFHGETDGLFNDGDYFEFYGDRHYGDESWQDDYTAENVYTLSLVNHLGARLAVENGGLVVSNSSGYIVPDAYQHQVHLEGQFIPDKLGRSWSLNSNFYREDIWFWKKITAPNLEIVPFELQYPKDTTIRAFSTKISLYGLTYMEGLPFNQYDHKATIRINQSLVSTRSWRDQREQIFENDNPLPNSYLNHGTNYCYISLNGETPMEDREQVMLDYIELTYWREYKTSEDFIKFTKPSNRPFGLYQFQLEGFSSNQVSVYKIGSSIMNNLQIEPFTQSGGQPWTVTFQDSVISQDVRYYAVTENKKKLPTDFRIDIPSNLKSGSNAADCIIITATEFTKDEGTLLYREQWENLGYQVQIVDIQDIFDEFNHGIRSAESIKDFLSYAYNNWSDPQLKSVFLLGDGTDDERDNSKSRKYNVVPVKKIWTYQHGATAADNWYACLVGTDPIPDISISRVNIWKKEQIIQVAQKTEKYITEPNFDDLWHGQLILATGGKQSDGNDIFSQQSEEIRRKNVPQYFRAGRVYTNTQTVSQDFYGVTSSLINKINEGAIFLQFMGHGGGRIWADYNLFNFNNVSSLNNSNYPIVSSLACYCSAFDTDGSSSISEALVLEPEKGAIATVGFTGLGYLNNDLDFGLALADGLFMKDFNSLGEAWAYTKAKFYVVTTSPAARVALMHGSVLLGDGNVKVLKPHKNVTVTTNKDNYSVGDTLRVTASFQNQANAARTMIYKPTEIAVNPPNENAVINGTYSYSYTLSGNAGDRYQRRIFVTGYSDTGEYYGYKDISLGRGLLSHVSTIPESPTWADSIHLKLRITGIDNISSVVCRVKIDSLLDNAQTFNIPMVRSQTDTTMYQTSYAVPAQVTGKEVFFKYSATNNLNQTSESLMQSFLIAGPELLMEDMQFVPNNTQLSIKVLIKNIGNSPSANTNLKLTAYQDGLPDIILEDRVFTALEVGESRWETIVIDTLFTNTVGLVAMVNIPRVFPEWSYSDVNNMLSLILPLNYQFVNSVGGMISSLDTNVLCEIPANLVNSNQPSIFYINRLSSLNANNEPDVASIKLRDQSISMPYEVMTLDEALTDSTGTLINGHKLKLTFYYSSTDSTTQQYETENSYMIYRWNDTYRKWIIQGGNISTVENKVVFEVTRTGIYTLMRNKDKKKPSIDVNVQDQEFTVGGYVSGTGTISLLISDANGIDVFDNSIKLFLEGLEIPKEQWVQTINKDDINRIPIKYQLNLPKGNYTLVVDCRDVNGNFNTRDVQFIVNDEFDVIRLANYPNPVRGKTQDPKNAGRTRFTYVLTDDADEVSIKVFTVSGRLVKTFRNLPAGVGYHEYPRTVYAWDCTDEQGFYLANGVYFYRIIAKKGGKTIEKIQKMAILK
jgi:hypothetical protein